MLSFNKNRIRIIDTLRSSLICGTFRLNLINKEHSADKTYVLYAHFCHINNKKTKAHIWYF